MTSPSCPSRNGTQVRLALPSALLLGLALAGLGTACRPEPPTAPAPPPAPPPAEEVRAAALARGKEIVAQAGRALSSVLLEAIEQGGTTNAFPLCSVQALPLTASLAQSHGVQLRRVSHRPRNPANRATPEELGIIERYAAALQRGDRPEPEVVLSDTAGVVFYSPIVINTNLCLQCHGVRGQDLRAEIEPLITQFYPQDEATGFTLGNLRGLWRVDSP